MARSQGKSEVKLVKVEAELAHWGIQATRDRGGQRRWKIVCGLDGCAVERDWFYAPVREHSEVVTHFIKAGWMLRRRSPPYCSHECLKAAERAADAEKKQRERQEMSKPPPKALPATFPPPPTVAAVPPVMAVPTVGPDLKLMWRCANWIEERFDKDLRRYRGEECDEKVAKDIGCSLEFVVKVRRELFGELAEDPEIARIKVAISEVTKAVEDGLARMDADRQRFAGEMTARLKELDFKLSRLAGIAHKAAG